MAFPSITLSSCSNFTFTIFPFSKDLMVNLFLAAGGSGGVSAGGGGVSGELTNWDGTKKRNGWGM